MRVALVIVVSLGVSVAAFAQEAPAAPAIVGAPVLGFQSVLPSPGLLNARAFSNRNATDSRGDLHSAQNSPFETDSLQNVCYKMRTYVVARDSSRSDAVRPVAYYTCLPGTKVTMKSADMQAEPAQ